MKNFIISLLLGLSIFTQGCATTESGQSPVDKAVEFIDSHRDWLKAGLVALGKNLLNKQTDEYSRKQIANQMWSLSIAFNSLATGETVTKERFGSAITSFSGASSAPGYTQYLSDASVIWGIIYPSLKTLNEPNKWKEYLVLASEAAQEVAASQGVK